MISQAVSALLRVRLVGASWAAFPTGLWHSDGGYDPSFDGTAFLQELYDKALPTGSDAFGNSAPGVYALSIGGDSSATVISELQERPADFAGSGPLRIAEVLTRTYDQGCWKATRLLTAHVLAEEFLLPCQDALYLGGTWERFPDPNATGPGPDQCSSLGSGTPVS